MSWGASRMRPDVPLRGCRSCRGYNLERRWCSHCGGSGIEPAEPVGAADMKPADSKSANLGRGAKASRG